MKNTTTNRQLLSRNNSKRNNHQMMMSPPRSRNPSPSREDDATSSSQLSNNIYSSFASYASFPTGPDSPPSAGSNNANNPNISLLGAPSSSASASTILFEIPENAIFKKRSPFAGTSAGGGSHNNRSMPGSSSASSLQSTPFVSGYTTPLVASNADTTMKGDDQATAATTNSPQQLFSSLYKSLMHHQSQLKEHVATQKRLAVLKSVAESPESTPDDVYIWAKFVLDHAGDLPDLDVQYLVLEAVSALEFLAGVTPTNTSNNASTAATTSLSSSPSKHKPHNKPAASRLPPHANSILLLAHLLITGLPLIHPRPEPRYQEAFKFYLLAADLGLPDAAHNAALLLDHGRVHIESRNELVPSLVASMQASKELHGYAAREGHPGSLLVQSRESLKLARSWLPPLSVFGHHGHAQVDGEGGHNHGHHHHHDDSGNEAWRKDARIYNAVSDAVSLLELAAEHATPVHPEALHILGCLLLYPNLPMTSPPSSTTVTPTPHRMDSANSSAPSSFFANSRNASSRKSSMTMDYNSYIDQEDHHHNDQQHQQDNNNNNSDDEADDMALWDPRLVEVLVAAGRLAPNPAMARVFLRKAGEELGYAPSRVLYSQLGAASLVIPMDFGGMASEHSNDGHHAQVQDHRGNVFAQAAALLLGGSGSGSGLKKRKKR